MLRQQRFSAVVKLLVVLWLAVGTAGTGSAAMPTPSNQDQAGSSVPQQASKGRIAFVYRNTNLLDADAFRGFLSSRGYGVTLVQQATVTGVDFSTFDLILIADDTGDLGTWGTDPAQVEAIRKGGKPIIGLGEGGYAFLGKLQLFIGHPNGAHGPEKDIVRAPSAPPSFYGAPNAIGADPVALYNQPVNTVGIFLSSGNVPADVVPLGLQSSDKRYAALIAQGCRQLWGFSGNARAMTGGGQDLFINAIEYGRRVPCGAVQGRIAYVYRGNGADASSFRDLLVARGYTVTLVPLAAVLGTDFSLFDLIVIADDTGSLSNWGTDPLQVDRIRNAVRPILGLGEGGYAFFGKLMLYIGWGNGWHGPQHDVVRAPTAPATYYNTVTGDPAPVYTQPVNTVGIYLGKKVPADVVPLGLENPTTDHASLIAQAQGCDQLWGFSGNPLVMTANGKNLFINAVEFSRQSKCGKPVPTPDQCAKVVKTATPPDGTPVRPGDVILYTLTYVFSADAACGNREAQLSDTLPLDTIFVPHSASDDIVPTVDRTLSWPVGPSTVQSTKSFKVLVSETQCRNQRRVVNRAGLLIPGRAPVISNVVTHPVVCQDVTLDNPNSPPYSESEIAIHPYPLITGTPSEISVRVKNDSSSDQDLTVAFGTSPDRFGIGLNFSAFSTRVVHVPAHGNVIVTTTFTPTSSGHYCIQVVVSGGTIRTPLVTARNIDVTEDLRPGVQDTLTFKVRNPTSSTANMELVVVNTCPGWSAIAEPAILLSMAPGEIRDAALKVTPPDPVTLGTGCHIDVQGFIGDQLIGGIRKLDVPPVHLPENVDPPWLEPEISVTPNPPVVGQPANLCVALQNPIGVARSVTVDFSVADFGAGLPFTVVGTQSFTLPSNSNAPYCITWTPAPGGTLHRCVLVTLHQAGQRDERSQRNLNLVRPRRAIVDISVEFRVGNPDGVPHKLHLDPVVWGIDPIWVPRFMPDPPPEIKADEVLVFTMQLVRRAGVAPDNVGLTAPDTFGDVSRVDVGVDLDDVRIGGFSAQIGPPLLRDVLLPAIAN
ncbi:MAG: hypothetical protein NVSMB42_17440 [Herpetosiphon sp.]